MHDYRIPFNLHYDHKFANEEMELKGQPSPIDGGVGFEPRLSVHKAYVHGLYGVRLLFQF